MNHQCSDFFRIFVLLKHFFLNISMGFAALRLISVLLLKIVIICAILKQILAVEISVFIFFLPRSKKTVNLRLCFI